MDGNIVAEWQPLALYENKTLELIGPKITQVFDRLQLLFRSFEFLGIFTQTYVFPHQTQHYFVLHGGFKLNAKIIPLELHLLKEWFAVDVADNFLILSLRTCIDYLLQDGWRGNGGCSLALL